MRKILAGLLAAGLVAACGDQTGPSGDQPADTRPDVQLADTVDLVDLVDALKAAMPGNGSGGYVPPTEDEVSSFLEAVDRALAGAVPAADSLLDRFGYDVLVVVAEQAGDSLVLFLERQPIRRGWGSFAWNRSAAAIDVDIHVNHPMNDTHTQRVGAQTYLGCRCRWLLMAGTHRYADADDVSDMARSWTSVFQNLHEHVAAGAIMALSIHGFNENRDEYQDNMIGQSHVVLSAGRDLDGEIVATESGVALRDWLRDRDWIAGLHEYDEGYPYLTGGSNPQGKHSNSTFGHGRWIHVELAQFVRFDAVNRERMAADVAAWAVAFAGGD